MIGTTSTTATKPPTLADVATLPQPWRGGQFRYVPHAGHELYVFGEEPDLAWFRQREPIELVWRAESLLVCGLAWQFTAIDPQMGIAPPGWCGCIYSHWTDPYRWPPIVCSDPRLLPASVATVRVILTTGEGVQLAERRVLLPDRFSQNLNQRIDIQRNAYNKAGWIDQVTGQLVRRYATPATLAKSAVHRCTAEDID